MTDAQIAALCEASDKHSPAPWGVTDGEGSGESEPWIVRDAVVTQRVPGGFVAGCMLEGDARLIAAARTLVPALLARAQAAEQELELHRSGHGPYADFLRAQRDTADEKTVTVVAVNLALTSEVARLRAALEEVATGADDEARSIARAALAAKP